MKDKELRKLRRADLLEILIEQGKEIERLNEELALANKKLEDRTISIENLGSMAEAAFKLNHVYEAVDAAAEQYIENVRQRCIEYKEYLDKKSKSGDNAEESKLNTVKTSEKKNKTVRSSKHKSDYQKKDSSTRRSKE